MKKYNTYWIQGDGTRYLLDSGESKDLRHACFNEVCKMIFLYPSIFKCENDKVMDNIQCGKNNVCEHYFAILGNEVISTMEVK